MNGRESLPAASSSGGGGGGPRSPFTPRSSRRLTSTNLGTPSRQFLPPSFVIPPLPPLNLRPLPDSPYASDPAFSRALQASRSQLDAAVSKLQSNVSSRQKDMAHALAEIEDEKRRVEDAVRNLGDVVVGLGETLRREREEEDEARKMGDEVAQRDRTLKVQLESLKVDVEEARAKLEERRAVKAKQRKAFEDQTRKNGPEIAFCEKTYGLKIQGKARDLVQFSFVNIDPAVHTRVFSFDLDASKPTYSLSSITPTPTASFLPETVYLPLLTKLNTSRDLFDFVIEMRRAFKIEVKLERMNFGNGSEGDRERDNERKKLREAKVVLPAWGSALASN